MSKAPIAMQWDQRRGGLFPFDSYSQEQCAALKEGDYNVRVSRMTKTGREEREGLRGLWWAGLGLLAENTEDWRFNEKRKAHDTILVSLGYSRPRFRIDKTFDMIPISTTEDSMDDDEFAILMERGEAYIVGQIGWSPWQSWKDEKDAQKANSR